MNVQDTIDVSKAENRITHIEPRDDDEFAFTCRALFDECDGESQLDQSQPAEFWGKDIDGNEWRVHVSRVRRV